VPGTPLITPQASTTPSPRSPAPRSLRGRKHTLVDQSFTFFRVHVEMDATVVHSLASSGLRSVRSAQGVTRRRLPSVHWSVARIESPGKKTEMSAPRNILRIVLLTAAAGLLAVAASVLREKKETVDLTTQQIEDAISALDPGTRAAVIGRLTADAVKQVKDYVDRRAQVVDERDPRRVRAPLPTSCSAAATHQPAPRLERIRPYWQRRSKRLPRRSTGSALTTSPLKQR